FAKNVLSAIPGILNYNIEVPKLDPCQLCGQEFIPHPANTKISKPPSLQLLMRQGRRIQWKYHHKSPQKDLTSIMSGNKRDLPLFESNTDIGLTQALQNKDVSSSPKSAIEPTLEICSKCSEAISPERSKPIVLLTCKHVIHFECIGNKRNLCPKCPSADDLEKEGYYISPAISINEAPKKKKEETGR
ncbi:8251_t:CDS:2, partial [Diversispora eburnea]